MVTCKAHNLETENACVGSIPTPATKKLQSVVVWELLRLKSYDQNDTHNFIFTLIVFLWFDLCECSTMASASAFQAEDDSSILFTRSNLCFNVYGLEIMGMFENYITPSNW